MVVVLALQVGTVSVPLEGKLTDIHPKRSDPDVVCFPGSQWEGVSNRMKGLVERGFVALVVGVHRRNMTAARNTHCLLDYNWVVAGFGPGATPS